MSRDVSSVGLKSYVLNIFLLLRRFLNLFSISKYEEVNFNKMSGYEIAKYFSDGNGDAHKIILELVREESSLIFCIFDSGVIYAQLLYEYDISGSEVVNLYKMYDEKIELIREAIKHHYILVADKNSHKVSSWSEPDLKLEDALRQIRIK